MNPKKIETAETPLMKQYNAIKAKYPDALLLFRVGDFYETFGEDAIRASGILGIVLTRRANGSATYIELAGFPHHALDTYLPKLVKSGLRVAICDQLEDPKLTKTIVKRGVTELVTPGVSYNDKILDQKENNFLCSIHLDPRISGVSFLDVSTGEFFLAQGSNDYIDKLIQSFHPAEVIVQKSKKQKFCELFGSKFYINTFEDWVFTTDFSHELLLKHFQTTSLKGFGVENMEQAVIAAGAAMHYLAETQHDRTSHITKVTRIEEDHYVWLDRFTIRNLELVQSVNSSSATLLMVLDQTVSPMGSRLLKRWIILPLKNRVPVEERLDIVEYFLNHPEAGESVRHNIQRIGDLERLVSKIAVARIGPREIGHLKNVLECLERLKELCAASGNEGLGKIGEQINICSLAREKIIHELSEDPPAVVSKGNVIRNGVSEELDELRNLAYSGKDYLVQIQQREIERTGITSLKIGYTNVFGYYLEVTNAHREKVPDDWNRKQTLVNAERYITEELKLYEEKILGAEEKILQMETKLFNDLVFFLSDYIRPLQLNASLVAKMDVLLSFAVVAGKNNYSRPVLDDSFKIEIKEGRHPVIEQQLKTGEPYISNDVQLDEQDQQILIITGPNMSGKSALLRQTALIVLMAQIGSFVPAVSARLGMTDKIFTRVGASDNIASGESTFMVEMNETASILNNISDRSLILLDEIGRGTSTYDGISIAWAIAQFLHEHPLFRAKVLFATHYHELIEMADIFPRIRNFHVSVKEINNRIIFLRKLIPGGSEHSFGIHVAKMAGMPSTVLEIAGNLMEKLEKSHTSEELGSIKDHSGKNKRTIKTDGYQLSFIQLDDPLLLQIKQDILNTDINTLTPVEALMKLNEIKKLLGR
ncbi:MAG: DNA mismatch repair protein MutS [Syntrophothermus sp.]